VTPPSSTSALVGDDDPLPLSRRAAPGPRRSCRAAATAPAPRRGRPRCPAGSTSGATDTSRAASPPRVSGGPSAGSRSTRPRTPPSVRGRGPRRGPAPSPARRGRCAPPGPAARRRRPRPRARRLIARPGRRSGPRAVATAPGPPLAGGAGGGEVAAGGREPGIERGDPRARLLHLAPARGLEREQLLEAAKPGAGGGQLGCRGSAPRSSSVGRLRSAATRGATGTASPSRTRRPGYGQGRAWTTPSTGAVTVASPPAGGRTRASPRAAAAAPRRAPRRWRSRSATAAP
jgi:hypothetical protein